MSFKGLQPILYGGREVWPLVEGGKGVSATNHMSSGAWAAAGGIGTVSAVNADSYDADGNVIPVYPQATRKERFEQLVRYGIDGATEQVRRAHEISGGKGAININVLWEMGGAQQVLEGVLENCPGMVTGVTCGAGMPYKLAEIAAKHNVHYLPIVSSARAFRALWKRSYSKVPHLMAAVVYEDPWLAGGHNGLSNAEDPSVPEDPYPRVKALRETMRAEGVSEETGIVMAGGVWFLREWENWIDNPELGKILFQFGTRPLLTEESPIPQVWKDMLRTVEPGDVLLHKFSPTGFYSSAVKTPFLYDLMHRSERQIPIFKRDEEEGTIPLADHGKAKYFWVHPGDQRKALSWMAEGFTEPLKTPDNTVVFVTPDSAEQIRADQQGCMGCLSHCAFSSWKDHDDHTTGRLADPRSFCIQKTLQDIAHGGDPDNNLAFAGHAAYRFKQDPFYSNNFTPTVKELVDRILTGIDALDKEVAVALINLVGSLLWPAVAVFGIVYFARSLKSGWLQRVLPDGGVISFGDAKLEISRSVRDAESAADKIEAIPKEAVVSEDEEKLDEESEPYDLVMDTWYALAEAITAFAVIHGGTEDRRRVWENLERLVFRGELSEAEKGAVRDLQKARNSIRRLGTVDRNTAEKYAETARRLTASFKQMAQQS